jgi:hypothetical protein
MEFGILTMVQRWVLAKELALALALEVLHKSQELPN